MNHKVHWYSTDKPLPHETLPRSGRATRWTNTRAFLRKGQLNRQFDTQGTDQPLPHETLPRSGRATRWTNTRGALSKLACSELVVKRAPRCPLRQTRRFHAFKSSEVHSVALFLESPMRSHATGNRSGTRLRLRVSRSYKFIRRSSFQPAPSSLCISYFLVVRIEKHPPPSTPLCSALN